MQPIPWKLIGAHHSSKLTGNRSHLRGNSRMLASNGFAFSPVCWAVQVVTYMARSPRSSTQKRAPDHAGATMAPGFPITGLLSTLATACKQIKEEFGGLMTLICWYFSTFHSSSVIGRIALLSKLIFLL